MCGHGEFYGHHGHGASCYQPDGFHGHPFHRHFPSQEERIARLEEHLKDIQAETKAVEERLAEMKATGQAKPDV
jgi:NADH:ubiquinone oxidoreductase subunit C